MKKLNQKGKTREHTSTSTNRSTNRTMITMTRNIILVYLLGAATTTAATYNGRRPSTAFQLSHRKSRLSLPLLLSSPFTIRQEDDGHKLKHMYYDNWNLKQRQFQLWGSIQRPLGQQDEYTNDANDNANGNEYGNGNGNNNANVHVNVKDKKHKTSWSKKKKEKNYIDLKSKVVLQLNTIQEEQLQQQQHQQQHQQHQQSNSRSNQNNPTTKSDNINHNTNNTTTTNTNNNNNNNHERTIQKKKMTQRRRRQQRQRRQRRNKHEIEQIISSSLERNILNAIWSCQTVTQVYYILYKFISTAKQMTQQWMIMMIMNNENDENDKNDIMGNIKNTNSSSNSSTILSKDDLHWLGPNIASAALRRIVDVQIQVQVQPPSTSTSTSTSPNGTYNTSNEKKKNSDVILAERYIPMLLQILTDYVSDVDVDEDMDADMDMNMNMDVTNYYTNRKTNGAVVESLLYTSSSPSSFSSSSSSLPQFSHFYKWLECIHQIDLTLEEEEEEQQQQHEVEEFEPNTEQPTSTSTSASTSLAEKIISLLSSFLSSQKLPSTTEKSASNDEVSSLSSSQLSSSSSSSSSSSKDDNTTIIVSAREVLSMESQLTHYSCVNILHAINSISKLISRNQYHDRRLRRQNNTHETILFSSSSSSSSYSSSSSSPLSASAPLSISNNQLMLYTTFHNIDLLQLITNICGKLLEPVDTVHAKEKRPEKDEVKVATFDKKKNKKKDVSYKIQLLTPKRSLETLSSLATLIQYHHETHKDNNIEVPSDANLGAMSTIMMMTTTTAKTKTKMAVENPTSTKNNIKLTIKSNTAIRRIIEAIGQRLTKGDAISQFNPYEITAGLRSFYVLQYFHCDFMKAYMKRLRKQPIRHKMSPRDLCSCIWYIGQLMEVLEEEFEQEPSAEGFSVSSISSSSSRSSEIMTHEEVAILFNECETCCYTLFNELLRDQNDTSNINSASKVNQNDDGRIEQNERGPTSKIQWLNARQVADILSTCLLFELEGDERIIKSLVSHIQHYAIDESNMCTSSDIARILWSMQRLKVRNPEEAVSVLVKRYVNCIRSSNEFDAQIPKTLNTVLRSVVMILPDDGRNELDLFDSVAPLLSDKNYLRKCNEFEVSNFAFVLAKANYYSVPTLKALSARMTDEDILSTCTPSSASRFLWSLSSLVNSSVEQDYEMDELLFEMFQSHGGILLSSQLTPVDTSSAMWAIAKSSYSLDMGIFDHLAETLAKDRMLERATVQQVCHALWACGKMINFEDPLKEKIESGVVTPPPYATSGTKYATFLVSMIDQMSPKDFAQTIWALGRLKISNMNILNVLASEASKIAITRKFNSQELANIVWGLSKTEFDNEKIISIFTKQMQDDEIIKHTTPQEAANVMYAMGKMMIRDKETFACMNEVVMRQLDQATTQTIANTLWAHDRVNLTPPQELFDSWANEKLDIFGLYLDNRQFEAMEET